MTLLRNVAWGFLLIIFPRRAQEELVGTAAKYDAGTETLGCWVCSPQFLADPGLAKLSLFEQTQFDLMLEYTAQIK